MTSVASPESCIPRSRPRRMSPSVTMPTRRLGAVQHQRDLNAAALDRGNGLAHRRVRSDDGLAPGFHGFLDLTAGHCPRALAARTPVYRGCEPGRQSPLAPDPSLDSSSAIRASARASCAFRSRPSR